MNKPGGQIAFFRGSYHFLSNFSYGRPIVVRHGLRKGKWKTGEHLYQSFKSDDPKYIRRMRRQKTPGDAKRLGQQVELRKDWEDVKEDAMRFTLRLKFRQGSYLAQKLIDTDPLTLIEGNTWGDRYWGVSGGEGQNRLGVLLMERRSLLINRQKD
jgi:ribA/ribD-fused uncharacterized protein